MMLIAHFCIDTLYFPQWITNVYHIGIGEEKEVLWIIE